MTQGVGVVYRQPEDGDVILESLKFFVADTDNTDWCWMFGST